MGLHILVVDDATSVRARLVEALTSIDGVARVDQAPGPADARDAIAQRTPDLLVLDIRMPGGSGIDLLRDIRRAGLRSTVVMLTNYNLAPYRQTCLAAGADYFLDKSTEFDRVVEIVSHLAREPGDSK